MTGPTLHEALEDYFDAVPRTAAMAEQVGPFTLFVGLGPWQYYARPRLGLTEPVLAHQVEAVIEDQLRRGVPPELEWQPAVTPSLLAACQQFGLSTRCHPLLVHRGARPGRPSPASEAGGQRTRVLRAEDPALSIALALQATAFDAAAPGSPADVAFLQARVAMGQTIALVREDADARVLAVGMHQPVGETSEVVGVATAASERGQGHASALTTALVADAYARGVRTVLLSAAGAQQARLYRRLGFSVVGQVCAAHG